MQLFYNPDITEVSKQFSFNKEESKHIAKVLRKKEGDIINITNGKGWLFKSEIILVSQNNCSVKVISKELKPKQSYNLHLAVAPTKMNDRYEWFLEKATEIGVDSITPIICEHSERKVIKHARLEKIIQSAMKQSLQCYLPKLNEVIKFSEFVKQDFDGQMFIAHCEETERKLLREELQPNKDITILIGPEGDFSVNEIQKALQQNFIPVTLGKNRLRTETAAIVACHSVEFINL